MSLLSLIWIWLWTIALPFPMLTLWILFLFLTIIYLCLAMFFFNMVHIDFFKLHIVIQRNRVTQTETLTVRNDITGTWRPLMWNPTDLLLCDLNNLLGELQQVTFWITFIIAYLLCIYLQNIPTFCSSGYSTLIAPSNEVLIPPELLSSQTVWTPERTIGNILFLLLILFIVVPTFAISKSQKKSLLRGPFYAVTSTTCVLPDAPLFWLFI